MAYSLEVIRKAQQRLASAKADRESQYQQRLQEAYQKLPRLRQIDQQLSRNADQPANHKGDQAIFDNG